MRAVRTQFDAGEFSGTVATPTCSSCCCCCCCVTTFVTASVVGASATAKASRHHRMPRLAAFFAVLLGGFAPWFLIAPLTLAVFGPWEMSGGILQLLGLGVLLMWAAYQALAMWLRPRTAIRSGLIVTGAVLGIGLLEAILVYTVLFSIPGLSVLLLTAYPVLAIIVAMLVSGRWERRDDRSGVSFVERLAGVTEPLDDEPTADD